MWRSQSGHLTMRLPGECKACAHGRALEIKRMACHRRLLGKTFRHILPVSLGSSMFSLGRLVPLELPGREAADVNVVLVDSGTVAVMSELDLELHLTPCHWPLADGAF